MSEKQSKNRHAAKGPDNLVPLAVRIDPKHLEKLREEPGENIAEKVRHALAEHYDEDPLVEGPDPTHVLMHIATGGADGEEVAFATAWAEGSFDSLSEWGFDPADY